MGSTVFRPSTPEDYPQLHEFLATHLQLAKDAAGIRRTGLDWKYWRPRPDWNTPRSYIFENAGRIEAHCGLFPATLEQGGVRLRACHFIDWAADPLALGAGVRLLRRITRLVDVTCVVGGSADTRKILPMVGFKPAGAVRRFAVPLRPVRHALTHQNRNWKLPVRFLRSVLWNAGRRSAPSGWKSRPCSVADVPDALWSAPGEAGWVRTRDASIAEYFLDCPIARFSLHLAKCGSEVRAAFLLAVVAGQARVADMWGCDEADYAPAYALALAAARSDAGASEAIALAASARRCHAITQSGMRFMDEENLLVYASGTWNLEGCEVQLIDSDAAFLGSYSPEYLA